MLGAAKKQIDSKVLRALVPLNALNEEHFSELLQQTRIEEVPAGKAIFKKGDTDDRSVYLLSGKVELIAKSGGKEMITGGTDQSRFPIAHHFPRQVTATAKNAVVIVRIDRSLLDALLTTEQTSNYEVVEIEAGGDDDWMTRMLNSKAFEKLPPSNIQALFMHMEAMVVKASDIIVREGEEGDYFYTIAEGKCQVSRENEQTGKAEKIATLSPGDSFGEETLIIGSRRNATVSMLTDGMLMRLSKSYFEQFFKDALLNKVSVNQALAMIELDGKWLDVRLASEFENESLNNSINIPLNDVRNRNSELDTQQTYIAYCDTGNRSSVAGFLLNQRGFSVYVLDGGLANIPQNVFARLKTGADPQKGEVVSINVHPEAANRKPDTRAVQQSQAELAQQKARLESERKKAAEEAMRIRGEAEAAKRKLEEEMKQLRSEAEQARKQAEEEAVRIRAEAEAARHKAEEEAARFKAEAEVARKKVTEDAKRLQSEKERAKKAVMAKSEQLRAEIDAEREKARQEATKLKMVAEQEALRLKQEAEQARTVALEEAERLKAEQEKAKAEAEAEAERLRSDAEQVNQKTEEAAHLKAEAETARKRADKEAKRMHKEAEQARKQAEASLAQLQKEREAARKVAEKEIAKLRAEAEKERSQAKEDALKLREEAENAKLKAEEDAAHLLLEAKHAKRDAEAEAARFREEEQASRLQAQADIAELTAEAEAARHLAKEEMRKKTDAEAERLRAKEEAARLRAEAEAVRLQKEEDANRLKQEAETLRAQAEEKAKQLQDIGEIEDTRLEAEEQAARLLSEAEEVRLKAQEEAAAVKAEAESVRLKAEEEANRLKVEAENASLEASEKASRLCAEAEAAKLKAEMERARLRAEQEQIKKKGEEARRLQTEAEQAQSRAGEDLERTLLTGSFAKDGVDEDLPEPDEEIILEGQAEVEPESGTQALKAPASFDFKDEEGRKVTQEAAQSGGSNRVAIIGGGIAAVAVLAVVAGLWLTGGDTASDSSVSVARTKSPGTAEQHVVKTPETAQVSQEEKALMREKAELEVALREQEKKEAAILKARQKAALKARKSGGSQPADDTQSTVITPIETSKQKSKPTEKTGPVVTAKLEPGLKAKPTPRLEPVKTVSQSRNFRDRLKAGGRGPEMVRLSASSFKMGSPASSPKFDERPRHTVDLQAFAIGKYEISVSAYNRFAAATGRGKLPGKGKLPAVKVSWADATAYTKWLSQQTGQRYRLPSEAEWEYAASGGANSAYWWGPVLKENRANCFGCGSQWDHKGPAPVGSFGANGFGLYDTAGNVLEWVQDCYHTNYQGAPTDGGVWPAGDCGYRMARGGAFDTVAASIRRAKRNKFDPKAHLNNIGFRVVRD